VGEPADTPSNTALLPVPGLGLGTVVQPAPFQCSINVLKVVPL
jgi:hypothetical protein